MKALIASMCVSEPGFVENKLLEPPATCTTPPPHAETTAAK
jgi:hypothetical protein